MIQRRIVIAAGAAFGAPAVLAHHGWSSFDQERPLYLEGTVAAVRWQNPHAELELDLRPGLRLPADLVQRALPAQSAPVDGRALLAKTAVPARAQGRWEVELAPLTRMQAWNVAPIAVGTTVAVVGFGLSGAQPAAVLRAEYLFVGGKAYALRSGPA